MTIHTLTEKAIAVTGLPEGATAWMNESYHVNTVWYKCDGMRHPKFFDLPEGNWSILGRAAELTEEQWKMVVPEYKNGHNEIGYPYYEEHGVNEDINCAFITATESGHSLLKSKGLHVSNPIKPPIERLQLGGDYAMRESEVAEWQSAQLISNPLILIQ